jgi:sec-independent protein translocase protein TatC
MSLADHLRELRSRMIKSAIAIFLFGIIGFVLRDQIMEFLLTPMIEAAERTGADARAT